MIDLVRSYHQKKRKYEYWVLGSSEFNNIKREYNNKADLLDYPIKADSDGIYVEIDEYRAYIVCLIKGLFNSSIFKNRLGGFQNICSSQLCKTIELATPFFLEFEQTKVSQIQIGFSIPTSKKGSEIVNQNIIMHNYKYYNHNKNKSKDKVIKKFTRTNFQFSVYANKKSINWENYIKIELLLTKSVEFRTGVNLINMNQLKNKETLKKLFSLLLHRFKELTVVDSIENYDVFDVNDKILMKEFMSYGYWNALLKNRSRQTVSVKKKLFESLLEKYNLLNLKTEIEFKLKSAFEEFINN